MKNQSLKTTTFLVTAACFLSFFVFGFTDNLKGPTLPSMIRELNIDYGISGNIFFGEYFGFIITSLIAGILADRFGLKVILLVIAVNLMAAGVAGYSSFSNITLLLIPFFNGTWLRRDRVGNECNNCADPHGKLGLYLNLMAVLHGLGSLIAPLFAGWLLAMNVTWRTIYRWDILRSPCSSCYFYFCNSQNRKVKTTALISETSRRLLSKETSPGSMQPLHFM